MKNHSNFYTGILAIILLTFASCQKVIDLKLNSVTGKLVIEGNVTNVNELQVVKLSQNVPFTNTNVYPPVSGATVTINDQAGNTWHLVEGPAGTYTTTTSFAGVAGVTYSLTVLTGNQTYTASSTMPALVTLDSLSSSSSQYSDKKNTRQVSVYFKDPAGVPNQYRFVMYVNGVQVRDVFTFNDEFSDGKNVNDVLNETDIDIYAGDAVKVEMQCVDEAIYTYWTTLKDMGTDSGGAVAPSNPPSNLTNGAYGYFSAHTTQTKAFTVK